MELIAEPKLFSRPRSAKHVKLYEETESSALINSRSEKPDAKATANKTPKPGPGILRRPPILLKHKRTFCAEEQPFEQNGKHIDAPTAGKITAGLQQNFGRFQWLSCNL
jgi:hypothetical protein